LVVVRFSIQLANQVKPPQPSVPLPNHARHRRPFCLDLQSRPIEQRNRRGQRALTRRRRLRDKDQGWCCSVQQAMDHRLEPGRVVEMGPGRRLDGFLHRHGRPIWGNWAGPWTNRMSLPHGMGSQLSSRFCALLSLWATREEASVSATLHGAAGDMHESHSGGTPSRHRHLQPSAL
jgi:hypothetical protein